MHLDLVLLLKVLQLDLVLLLKVQLDLVLLFKVQPDLVLLLKVDLYLELLIQQAVNLVALEWVVLAWAAVLLCSVAWEHKLEAMLLQEIWPSQGNEIRLQYKEN